MKQRLANHKAQTRHCNQSRDKVGLSDFWVGAQDINYFLIQILT